ncbi:MAG: carbohydrate kinase family protein [Bryobacteraceae bacterium]
MLIQSLKGVLCAGNISWDILVRPVNEFRWGTNTWVDEMIEDMGGNGSNTSYVLGRLGVPARTLGMVGRDERGDKLIAKLAGAGVDTAHIARGQGPTTTTICVVNSQANRLFMQRLGSSLEAFAEATVFEGGVVAGVSHYHQANLFSVPNLRRHSAAQMRRARYAGLTTSLDTGWATDGRWMETLETSLPLTDLLFVNEEEAHMITGRHDPAGIASTLRAHGATDIIVKLGARGCVVFAGAEETAVEAFPVPIVDTTGAGDCFAGGFFAALYRGYDYVRAARYGNAAGALSVSRLGAVKGIAGWDEMERWISTHSSGARE